MKAEDIYNKALTEYPIKEKLNEKAVGTYDANYPRRKAFVAGAEWMQDRTIEKAVEWLSNNMFHSINNGVQINGTCVSDFVEKFKQAMEDESRRLD